MSPQTSIRLLPGIRSSYVERVLDHEPRRTLCLGTEYGEGVGRDGLPVEFVGRFEAVLALWRSHASMLELPEPLWLRFLPLWLMYATVWRLRVIRGRDARIGFYAIENNRLEVLLFGGRSVPRILIALTRWVLRHVVGSYVDRCVFGTDAAAALYAEVFGWPSEPAADRRVIHNLPSPRAAALRTKRGGTAAFVGALDDRKGIRLLLPAWESVERDIPNAHLTLFGSGVWSELVDGWAACRPDSRTFMGAASHTDVMSVLAATSVVVAPSIPSGRWREQVGLPITEGLSTGATVVTSSETGLAELLVRMGHLVVPTDSLAAELSSALKQALRHPVNPTTVLRELPSVDGRLAADRWLHRPWESNHLQRDESTPS
jgi:glycosyltransferase involved in cell wall biosynthesis